MCTCSASGPVRQSSCAEVDAEVKVREDRLGELVELADHAARTASERDEGRRAAQVALKLRERRFVISVVGEFKRGKSTLVNALVGESVLPVGVLPLTAVATELAWGEPSVTVVHLDGASEVIERSQLADYVTEERNPNNSKGVARVVLTGRWSLLRASVVLVDTPGIGSVHEHNTAAAKAALLGADGAIVVMGAASPLSAAELEMLGRLRSRHARTFYVVNKVDQLQADEVLQVKQFIERVVKEATGREPKLYLTDARRALRGEDGVDFKALVDDLEDFVDTGLTAALVAVAERDLGSIGSSLRASVALERAAFDMDQAELARLSELFSEEASRQRVLYEDDLTIARRDVDELVRAARRDIEALSAARAKEFHPRLDAAAEKSLHDGESYEAMADRLRKTIEDSVRDAFEDVRGRVLREADAKWNAIAGRLRANADQRVAALRSAASELFEVELPAVETPPLSEQADLFSYLFLRVGSSTDLFSGVAARLVPARFAWHRIVRNASKELDDEIAKHAGRAGWDLSQRLSAAITALDSAMRHEIEVAVAEVERAARRADERRKAGLAEQERTEGELAELDDLASRLISAGR
ncbi:MAG: dynamin family protein [Acidimicrobiales bacterium]